MLSWSSTRKNDPKTVKSSEVASEKWLGPWRPGSGSKLHSESISNARGPQEPIFLIAKLSTSGFLGRQHGRSLRIMRRFVIIIWLLFEVTGFAPCKDLAKWTMKMQNPQVYATKATYPRDRQGNANPSKAFPKTFKNDIKSWSKKGCLLNFFSKKL